jgi:hypothetical protein
MLQLMVNVNCFKIYFLHEGPTVTIELIDTDVNEDEIANVASTRWTSYVHDYIQAGVPTCTVQLVDCRRAS